jgi:hypothetical protein
MGVFAPMQPPRGVTKVRAALASRSTSALALAIAGAALGSCVPTANVADLPDGAASLPCYGNSCIPNMVGAPVTTAATVDCDALYRSLDLDFADQMVVLNNENPSNVAQYLYQYVDGTAGIWPSGYEPPVITQNVCLGETNNHVLHESGGPFTGWGGGIGIGLAHLNSMTDNGSNALCSTPAPSVVCPAMGGRTTSTPCYCPPIDTEPGALGSAIASAALDVSQWDGISFWARRGENGQPLMRVLVGDKFTDDDISYLEYLVDPTEPRLCTRKSECSCLYQDTTCDWYSSTDPAYASKIASMSPPLSLPDTNLPTAIQNGGYFCGAPGSHPGQASSGGTASNSSVANICGRSICDYAYPAYPSNGTDPEWVGRACTPYTYRNGTQADVCYNPPGTVDANGNPVKPDELPAEPDEQCGDHFTFPVHLSTDWQFFTIPFAEMSQQGWAKQAPYFDLTSVSVVRFTWDVGYVDYYLDDVRFYRVHRAGADGGVANTPPP